MPTIEDRLWTDLIREPEAKRALATQQPPPQQRRRRAPLALASVLLLGAILAATLTLTAGTSTTPAYAVDVNANGSVTLTLKEVIGVNGANEALARLGVRVRIAQIQAGCTQTNAKAIPPGRHSQKQRDSMVQARKVGEGLAGLHWIIHPDAIPQGDTVLITAQLANDGRPIAPHSGKAPQRITSRSGLATSIGLYHGTPPTCLPTGESQPG